MRLLRVPKDCINWNPYCITKNAKFMSANMPECDVSDEWLMVWKGSLSWKVYIPSKSARFGIKTFELCEDKSGYIWNFVIYIGQDTVFENSIKERSHRAQK
jgi:hypothetical protein